MKIMQSLDLLDAVQFIDRKTKVYIATLLGDIEPILGKDTEEFKQVRKLILDSFNGFKKSVLMIIFGSDFEDKFDNK
jgi:hypothetical protein